MSSSWSGSMALYVLFLGSLTIIVGLLCLYFLGTPFEVPWLTKEEKRMANTRILENQSVHDQTGTKVWKWDQARECLVDLRFYFAGINAFPSLVPNGCLTTFGSIINTSFGFSSLQAILYTIPRSMTSVVIFVIMIVGLVTSKWKNLHLYIMAFATIPPFGFLGMALIETSPSTKWTKWGMYYMTSKTLWNAYLPWLDEHFQQVPFVLSLFLAWTVVPSNLPRTYQANSDIFIYVHRVLCWKYVQITDIQDEGRSTLLPPFPEALFIIPFSSQPTCQESSDAAYASGLSSSSSLVCVILINRCRDKAMLMDRITQEEREMQGKINGESDMTDFENPHFRYTL
ncbi:hypothetical protein IW262DRAFT_1468977 [Armillaria fumosa]|nr:hypothetical protein IW262DRAFT_1468977 [Armillaria fumosa]